MQAHRPTSYAARLRLYAVYVGTEVTAVYRSACNAEAHRDRLIARGIEAAVYVLVTTD